MPRLTAGKYTYSCCTSTAVYLGISTAQVPSKKKQCIANGSRSQGKGDDAGPRPSAQRFSVQYNCVIFRTLQKLNIWFFHLFRTWHAVFQRVVPATSFIFWSSCVQDVPTLVCGTPGPPTLCPPPDTLKPGASKSERVT